MCGIVTLFRLPSSRRRVARQQNEEAVRRGVAALRHRGPDNHAVWSEGDVALGHARLSIVDLEGGRQPIVNERAAVVVNGAIYGHDELLADLERRGHQLQTRSDSEAVLHLYEEHGVGCLEHLRGQFAFVLWDRRARRLFAARDRFGIKPLMVAEHEGALYLGSEIKALFAAGVPARWDDESAYAHFAFAGAVDRTLFDGVRQLPPGHALIADAHGTRVHRYWRPSFPVRPQSSLSHEALVERTRTRLDEAVKLRTRADVPVGAYLSGGVDSSTALALGARHRSLTAFTVGFDDPDVDEGAAVVVASTDTEELVRVCHRVLVIVGGVVAEEVVGDDISAERIEHAQLQSA